MPDTGTAGHSTGGYNQYVALQQICPKATLDKTTTNTTATDQSEATRYDPVNANWPATTTNYSIPTCLNLRQKDQGKKIQIVNSQEPDCQQQYVEQRARGAYIASICQPEACFDLSTAAQNRDPDAAAIKALNQRLQWQKDCIRRGLIYRPLDLATAKLFVFVDGSFANNSDLTS
jgi:hypothetical protein